MNLLNYTKTPIHRVLEAIRSEAARYGVTVAETEFVGPVPMDAVQEIVRFYIQCHEFKSEQVLEMALLDE
jgi:glutamate formiminotransferase